MPLYRVQHILLRSGGSRYNCLDAFIRFQVLREREVYKREGISQVEAYKRGREIGHLVI